jgi:hypothetical protein
MTTDPALFTYLSQCTDIRLLAGFDMPFRKIKLAFLFNKQISARFMPDKPSGSPCFSEIDPEYFPDVPDVRSININRGN